MPIQSRKIYGIVKELITHEELVKDGMNINKIKGILENFGSICDEKFIEYIYQIASYNMQKLGDVVGMVTSSLSIISEKSRVKPPENALICQKDITLSDLQQKIADEICKESGKFYVSLLDGVTGGGKTAVFLKVAQNILSLNPESQVLVCLPEISLTPQTQAFFANILGFHPTVWHSSISKAQKKISLKKILNKEARVIIGTRSSILLPFANLKLIIIDEEHDSSYKQSENVIYSGRDMAIMRAKIWNIPIILSSATPSVETHYNAIQGKYNRYNLNQRFSKVEMPEIKLIDMADKAYKAQTGKSISPKVIEIAKTYIESGGQVLFFLNRRGFSTSIICGSCRSFVECVNCSVNMAYHKSKNLLICHYCGYYSGIQPECKKCNEVDKWVKIGFGVEKVSEELGEYFPDTVQHIFSSDNIDKGNMNEVIDDITSGKTQIIIGTQMISKGYNFPKLKCVVIVDTDTGHLDGDFRIYEKTYQTITQVAGRAGRFDERGLVLIQTFQVNNPAILSIIQDNKEAFYKSELARRDSKYSQLPPITRQIAIIIASEEDSDARTSANEMGKYLASSLGNLVKIFGPAPSLVKRVNKQYRYRLIISTAKNAQIMNQIRELVIAFKAVKSIVKIDVDPKNFL